jgi:hypothetical protein
VLSLLAATHGDDAVIVLNFYPVGRLNGSLFVENVN